MSKALTLTTTPTDIASREFLTVRINHQLFGIPVLQVQDVLGPQKVTRVPLAPPEICGSLNLRGRIVTAIDVRTRLRLPEIPDKAQTMSVVVDMDGEFYSLIFDGVGDVLQLDEANFEETPSTLDPMWREVATGIYRLPEELLVILSIERLIRDLEPKNKDAA